jgi:hypothetical protein
MRKYTFKLVLALFAVASFFACEPEKKLLEEENFHVRFSNEKVALKEENVGKYTYSVDLVAPHQSSGIDVTYKVSGTAEEGVDYKLLSPTSVTIAANSSSAPVEIEVLDDLNSDGTKNIVFEIESVSGGFSAGLGLIGKTFEVELVDNDCPLDDWSGDYALSIVGSEGSANEGFDLFGGAIAATVTLDPNSPIGIAVTSAYHDEFLLTLNACPETVTSDDTATAGDGEISLAEGEGIEQIFDPNTNTIKLVIVLGPYGNFDYTLTKL